MEQHNAARLFRFSVGDRTRGFVVMSRTVQNIFELMQMEALDRVVFLLQHLAYPDYSEPDIIMALHLES